MEIKDNTMMESKDLLENRVHTPVQAFSTPIKYPCTGFCYLVAKNKEKIVELYYRRNPDGKCKEYHNYILELIKQAGERKKNNPNIHERGEYIDQETVKNDFTDIYNNLTFTEVGSPDEESFAIAQNNLYMLLMDTKIGGYMMVTRSHETFIMLKLDLETMLVVDSHQAFHGTLNLEKATQYILKNGIYRGLSQIGYTSNGLLI